MSTARKRTSPPDPIPIRRGWQDDIPSDYVLKPAQVCEILGISERTLDGLRKAGDLRYFKLAGRVLFHPDEFRADLRRLADRGGIE